MLPVIARVLLATDGSERSTAGLPFLARVAACLGAHVDVVHVAGRAGDRPVPHESRLVDEAVAGLLERSVSADGHLRSRCGRSTAQVIAGTAGQLGADLVVLAPRGSSSVEAATRGSVTHDLLNVIDTPVLLLRGSPRSVLSRVLVAIADYSDIAGVTGLAAALATPAEADGWVVHVRGRRPARGASGLLESTEDATALAVDALWCLECLGVTAGYSVELGPAPYAIAMAARRTGADMIVLGRGQRVDWRDVLIGDVTGEVIRRADRPVLVAGRGPRAGVADVLGGE